MIIDNEISRVKPAYVVSTEAKLIIEKYVSLIPKFLMGPDRVSYLIEHYNEISHEERFCLIEVMNNLLKVMIDKEASDIELGGYGTEGYVWFRIYGKKEPMFELPKFSYDESALIILSILNEKQKQVLEQVRNLDFSYTFEYLNNMYAKKVPDHSEIRFRGDAFFDVDRLSMNMRSIVPDLRTLDQLEFPSNALKALSYNYVKQGLILITGITGSGKSTTLDA
ncbi:MAG TPA: ATPase, T2SS/T4P/T4SS family, partial [Ignavibacteriaceae bacterium]|nr:ATPase, T2SS/T4P/T4SS family [Ignavibacteriaceae bacterium]